MSFTKASGGNTGKRVKNDYYPTPPIGTYSLAKMVDLPNRLWEPAAGRGHMVKELRRLGYDVIGTELNSYDDPLVDDLITGEDFLSTTLCDNGTGIVTNPPYKLAKEFVKHALSLSNFVAVLCRIQFIESEKRLSLFKEYPLTWLLPFSARFDFSETQWQNRGHELGGMICNAWFVWDYRTPDGKDSRIRIIDTRAMLEKRRVELKQNEQTGVRV